MERDLLSMSTRVSDLLKSRSLTQNQLADGIQLSPSAISRLLSDQRTFTSEILDKISLFFGITTEELIVGTTLEGSSPGDASFVSRADYESLRAKLPEIAADLQSARAEVSSLNEANERLLLEQRSLVSETVSQKARIEQLESDLQRERAELMAQREAKDAVFRELLDLRQRADSDQNKLERLNRESSLQAARNQELEKELVELRRALGEAKREFQVADVERRKLNQDFEGAKRESAATRNELKNLGKRYEEAQERLEQTLNQASALEHTNSRLQSQIWALQSELNGANGRLMAAHEKLREAGQQLQKLKADASSITPFLAAGAVGVLLGTTLNKK